MTLDNSIVYSRPLSVSENFFRCRTASGNYRNFVVTATYNQSLKKKLYVLVKALRKTILEYPILATTVKFDKTVNAFAYVPLKTINLSDILFFEGDEKWLTNGVINENYMKYCNETQFKLYEENVLFKLILVGDFHLSAIFEHTIGDGLVANYFHEVLLKNLAECESIEDAAFETQFGPLVFENIKAEDEIFNFSKDKLYIKNSLPPPIDPFLEDIDLDYSFGDPHFQDKIIPKGFPNKWKGRFDTVDTHDISFKLINFSKQETKIILSKCKEHKVGITSYIEVVHALTLQPIFGDNSFTTHRTAMTLRRHYTPDLAEPPYKKILSDSEYKIFGTLAHMGFVQNFPPIKVFSWDLVKKVNLDLSKAVKNKRALNQMKLWKDTGDLLDEKNMAFFDTQYNKPKADAVKISNLGFIELPEYVTKNDKKWVISDMVFSQDMAPYASEFMLSVVSTPIGGMNFVLSYYDYSFEDGNWENFDEFVTKLHDNMLRYASF